MLKRESFDLVYTGIGALCWLPSIDRWAGVVSALLRPGGRLFIREGHPVLWATADRLPDGLLLLDHPYFEQPSGTRFVADGTYVATDVAFAHNTTIEWNHGLGEIVTALLDHGLDLTMLVEHDSVPWDALPGHMDDIGAGEFRLIDRPERLPHSYTLSAVNRLIAFAQQRRPASLRCTNARSPLAPPVWNGYAMGERTSVTTCGRNRDAFLPARAALRHDRPGAVPVGRDVRVPLRQAPQGLRRHAQRHARAGRGERLAGGHHPQVRGQEVQPGRPDLEPQPLLGVDGARWRWRPERRGRRRRQRGFGSFDKFKEEFKTSATGQFGSGWTWLTIDGGKLAISSTSNADLPMKHGQTAVLTCDVWEHAYYIDYRNRRPDYVDTFLDHLINWKLLDDALG